MLAADYCYYFLLLYKFLPTSCVSCHFRFHILRDVFFQLSCGLFSSLFYFFPCFYNKPWVYFYFLIIFFFLMFSHYWGGIIIIIILTQNSYFFFFLNKYVTKYEEGFVLRLKKKINEWFSTSSFMRRDESIYSKCWFSLEIRFFFGILRWYIRKL